MFVSKKAAQTIFLVFLLSSSVVTIMPEKAKADPPVFFENSHIYYNITGVEFTNSDSDMIFAKMIDIDDTGQERNITCFSATMNDNKDEITITIQDNNSKKFDDDGWINEDYEDEGYILLNERVLKKQDINFEMENFAVEGTYWRMANEAGVIDEDGEWVKIYVDDCLDKEIKLETYDEPVLNEQWYTVGSSESILLERPMYITKTVDTSEGLELFFDHPVNHEGQQVKLNKSWLINEGFNLTEGLQFALGVVNPWQPLSYTEDEDFFYLNPPHFSTIGIYQSTSGETVGGFREVDDAFYLNAMHEYKEYILNDVTGAASVTDVTMDRITDDKFIVVWKYSGNLWARVIQVTLPTGNLGELTLVKGEEIQITTPSTDCTINDGIQVAGLCNQFSDAYAIVFFHESKYEDDFPDYYEWNYFYAMSIKNPSGTNNVSVETSKVLMFTRQDDRVSTTEMKVEALNGERAAMTVAFHETYRSGNWESSGAGYAFAIFDWDGTHYDVEDFDSDPGDSFYYGNNYPAAVNKGETSNGACYVYLGGYHENRPDDNGEWMCSIRDADFNVEWSENIDFNSGTPSSLFINPEADGAGSVGNGKFLASGDTWDGVATVTNGDITAIDTTGVSGSFEPMVEIDYLSDWDNYETGCKIYYNDGSVGEYVEDGTEAYDYNGVNSFAASSETVIIDDDVVLGLVEDGDSTYIYPIGFGGAGNVTITRGSGVFESNNIVATAEMDISADAVLWVPAGTQTKGVMNFTDNNNPSMSYTEVSSKAELDTFGEYFYDSSEPAVFIYIGELEKGDSFNYSINLTQDSEFWVYPPTFLRSGDNFACRGMIADAEGEPVEGTVATTTIYGPGYRNDSFYNKNEATDFSNELGLWTADSSYQVDYFGVTSRPVSYYPWGNTSLTHRKVLSINANSPSSTGGIIQINLTYGIEMNDNFSDIRFTNKTGTEYEYHILNKTNGSYANVFVNVSDPVSTGEQIIGYVYYGNITAVSNSSDVFLFYDGFETDFTKWDENGATDWSRATDYVQKGTYSAACYASNSDDDLISDNIDLSTRGNYLSFWYRDDDIDTGEALLQLWDGSQYITVEDLGILGGEDVWHFYECYLNSTFSISNFSIKFEGTNTDSGENLWIDEVYVYQKINATSTVGDEESLYETDGVSIPITSGYAKQATIRNNIEGAVLKVEIGYNSGGDVDCEGNCNDNFSDVTFYSYKMKAELPFYLGDFSDAQTSTFYINNSYNDSIIWVVYGTGDNTSNGEGEDTFLFFDDFTDSSLDTSKWDDSNAGTYTYDASNDLIYFTGNWDGKVMKTDRSFDMPIKVESRWNHSNIADTDSFVTFSCNFSSAGDGDLVYYDYTTSVIGVGTEWEQFINNEIRSTDLWYSSIKFTNTQFDATSTLWGNWINKTGTPSNTSGYIGVGADTDSSTRRANLYWIGVHKYTEEEQSISSTGEEITLAPDTGYQASTGYVNISFQYIDANNNPAIIEHVSYNATEFTDDGDINYYIAFNNQSYSEFTSFQGSKIAPALTDIVYFSVKVDSDAWDGSNYTPYLEQLSILIFTQDYLVDDTSLIVNKWNCSHGNYECDISTTALTPSIYSWDIVFWDYESDITYKQSGPLYLDTYPSGGSDPGPYAYAHLYYSFFDLNTGTGLDDNYFKFYISSDTDFNEGDRVKGGTYYSYLGQPLHYKITDFFDNKIYPTDAAYSNVTIDEAETYIDCGVNLRQFRVKNQNHSTIYFIVRDDATDLQVGRWIPPYEEATFFLLDNDYNLTVQYYNSATSVLEQTIYVDPFTVSSDTFYWIPGHSLADIVIDIYNVNSSILNQIINVGVNINNDGSNIINQVLNSNNLINNIDSNISSQHADIQTSINNMNTSINQQVNSVWFAVNNTNTTMLQQSNLIKQTISNTNTNITTQMNSVLQNVSNVNTTVVNQANLILQKIINTETNITNQVNSVWQTVNNSNNTNITNQLNFINQSIYNSETNITNQLNIVRQDITNMNGTIGMQLNTMSQNITNMNLSIDTQMNALSQNVTNMNTSINTQFNGITSKIINTEANITTQVNSVWASVNNSNTSMHYQLNIVTANITNMNASIHTQINLVSTKITNTETNIINQVNQIDVMISNMESNLTNEINAINISIINNNTNITNQLNAILVNISNTNSTIVEQANLISSTIINTESNITTQLNGINTMIINTESNITSQINIVLTNISNRHTNISSQLNVINTQITNVETNLTNQFNYIEVQLTNTESNITNQINSINTTITNVNGSIHTQLNAIMTKIINTNLSMIDQINLIWSEINTTNSTVHTQIIGVNTKITTMWSNINYSFTVIESNVSYMNTTIVNLITDMNATLLAQLSNVLDNVSESGVGVFDRVNNVLSNLSQINTSLHDEIIGQALNIMDDMDVLNTNLTNMTLAILENISNINISFNDSSIQQLLNLTQTLQQEIAYNFSYISNRISAVQTQIDLRIDSVLSAIDNINITGYNDMMSLLEGILEQFTLPHEWQLPQVNYTLNDSVSPMSSISASNSLGGGISVYWSSTDNNPLFGVSYVTISYRIGTNASWKVWKAATIASGTARFDSDVQTLVEDTEYWFKCIGVDAAGNIENASDSNMCNITYCVTELPTSQVSSASAMLQGAMTDTVFIIGMVMLFSLLIGLYLYKKSLQRKMASRVDIVREKPYFEDVY